MSSCLKVPSFLLLDRLTGCETHLIKSTPLLATWYVTLLMCSTEGDYLLVRTFVDFGFAVPLPTTICKHNADSAKTDIRDTLRLTIWASEKYQKAN